ncbi:hypothetical protein L5515_009423 [Caenorhabditis briggsae]|uniref:Uncharacterized protein n=1 Tax=Caenorhabditis briggsae TaxID=6238 RepID=A0AAE9JNW5_CAEBR|nr:hypothetical protein L5515_009423 [Caenorhabditis briggsae]
MVLDLHHMIQSKWSSICTMWFIATYHMIINLQHMVDHYVPYGSSLCIIWSPIFTIWFIAMNRMAADLHHMIHS